MPVDGPQIPLIVGPLIPDTHSMILQVGNVRISGQEPQQFVDDRPQMQLLRRHQRKTLGQIEPHLVPEQAQRAGPGAILLDHAAFQDRPQQLLVLSHECSSTGTSQGILGCSIDHANPAEWDLVPPPASIARSQLA